MASAARKPRVDNRKKTCFKAPLLGLEILEERCTPATHTWIGTTDGTWSNPANWQEGVAPANGETGPIVLTFGALTGGTKAMIDDIAGLNVDQLDFTASGYSVTCTPGSNGLTLSGATTPAVLDSAGGNSILATNSFSINLASAATVEVDAGIDTFAAPISGGFGVTKAGSGTLVVSGASLFTGSTTVSAGILQLGAAGVGTATPLGETGAVVNTGASLDLNGFSLTAALPLRISGTGIAGGGALANSSTTAATYTGLLTLGADASIVGTGNIVVSNVGTITGSGFGLTLGGTATASSLVSIVGTGAGTVTKSGTGTWVVSGASTYTGATNINAGILMLGATGSGANTPLGTSAGATIVASGATLDLNGKTLTANEPLKISGTGAASTTAGALLNSATTVATFPGLVTLGASALVSSGTGTGGNLILSNTGTITGATFTLTFGGVGNASSISSIIGTTTGGVNKIGAGKWSFAGISTYTGNVTISAGIAASAIPSTTVDTGSFSGLTVVSGKGAFGAFNFASSKITVTTGGTLDINGGSRNAVTTSPTIAASDFAYGCNIAGLGSSGQGAIINTGTASGNGQVCIPVLVLDADAGIGGTTNIDQIAPGYTASLTSMTLNNHTLKKLGSNSYRLVNSTITAGTVEINNGAMITESIGTSSTNIINAQAAAFIVDSAGGIFGNGSTYTWQCGSISDGVPAGNGAGTITMLNSTFDVGYLTNSNASFGGIVSNSTTSLGSVIKLGNSTWTLGGANTAAIPLVVKEGTLVAAGLTSITNFGSTVLGDSASASLLNATLDLTASFTYTHPITVVGLSSDTYTIQDDGGNNTFTGNITISSNNDTLTLNQNATVLSTLQLNGSITSTSNGNLIISNGGTTTDAVLILAGAVNVTGTVSDNENPNSTSASPAIAPTTIGATIGGSLVGSIGAKVTGVTQSATTSPLTLAGNNVYTTLTTVSAGTVTVTGNELLATGGWNIGNSNGLVSQSVTFAAGSTIAVASGKSIQLGATGTSGQAATLVAAGIVNNSGALDIQRNGQLTDGGTWTQSGAMLLAAPSGSGVPSSMTVASLAAFTYNNAAAASPILIEPAANSAGSAILTIAGTFTTNQGFSDPVAASTGSANISLTGGTLALAANADAPTLIATAGSPFNFVLGTSGTLSGGTISIPSGISTSMNGVVSGTGGLSKFGGGLFTLGGSAVDTFTGGLTVGGPLNLDFTGLATPKDLLNSSNNLSLFGASIDIIGNAAGNTSQTISSVSLPPLTANSISLNPGTGASTNLTITGILIGFPTSALNFNYASGTTNGGTVGNDIVAWSPTLTNGLIGGGYTVTDAGGTGFATVVGGDVVRLSASNPLPVAIGDPTQNYAVSGTFSTINSTIPGSLVEALVGPVAANSVSVDTTGLPTGANLSLGTSSLTLAAGMAFGGGNSYTITSATSTAGILSATPAGAIFFDNYDSSPVTIAAPILDNSVTSVSLNGTGTTVFSGANQYAGDTTINNGASLQIGDPGSLGGGSYAGNISNFGALEYSSSVSQTLSGFVSGSGGLTKDGSSSTLTLAGSNSYTGPTVLKAGTISVLNSGLAFSNAITLGDPTATAGSVLLNTNAAFNYAFPISVVGANQTDTIASNSANETFSGPITLTGSTLILSSASGPGVLTDSGGGSGTGNLVTANNANSVIIVSTGGWNIAGSVMNTGTGPGPVSISSVLGSSITGVQQNSSTSPLVLGGASTFTSGTTINAGTLQMNGNSTLTGTGAATVFTNGPLGVGPLTIGATGTLDLNIDAVAATALIGSGVIGSSAASGSPTAKLTIVTGAAPQTYAGTIISGLQGGNRAVAIGLVGTGSMLFTNANNTYGGGTSIGSGTMFVAASTTGTPGALSSGPLGIGPITLGSASSGGLLSIGGAFTVGNAISVNSTTGTNTVASTTDNNVVLSGAIALSGNATISQVANTGTNALTVSGGVTSAVAGTQTLTFAGPGNIVVSGSIGTGTGSVAATIASGNVTFSGASTYAGATNVSGGTLTVSGSIGTASAVTVGTSGTLAGTGTLGGAVAVSGALDPGGAGAVGALTLGGLSFTSTGVLNLDLGAASSDEILVTGSANLALGTLQIASSAMPIGTTVTILHSTGPLTNTFNNLSNGSSITFASGIYTVHYDTVNNNVTLTFVQPPSITSANVATFTVGALGTFALAATGTTPISYSVTSGNLPSGVTLSSNGILSGTPAPGTAGSYPLIFTASNGGSQDQAFTLNVFGFTSAASTTIAVGSPAAFTMTTIDGSAPVTFTHLSADTLPAGVTFSNGVFSGSPLAGTEGTYTVNADAGDGVDADALQTFTLTVAQANLIYVSNSGYGRVPNPNPGDTVDGDEGTTGTQAAIFGGNALTTIADALSNIAPGGTILVNAGTYPESPVLFYGGTFGITGNVTVTSVDSFQSTTIDLQGNTLTEGDSTSDDTIGGAILGTGGLVKVGIDTLTLTGPDTYTGTTTVSAGSLLVNGTLVSSVNVDSGATLGGFGTISGAISMAAGSVLAPGLPSTIFTLSTGNLNMATGSTFAPRINGSSPNFGYDQVNVTGSVDLDALSNGGATLNVSLGAFVPSPNSVYVLVNNDGTDAVTGLFQTPGGVTLHNGDPLTVGSTNFRIYYTGGDGNDVVLVEASTPSTVYVSSSNFGLSAAPTVGESVDGDQGLGGTQTAVYGLNAFASISSALTTVASAGAVIVNAGTYAESPNLTNPVTMQLSGGNVTVNALDSAVGTTIDLQGNQLTTGAAAGSDTLAGTVIGSGGLTKVGSSTLTLSGADSYFGGTSISAGSLIVNGSLNSSSTVTISGTGVLGGSGTVGNVNNLAGAVNPGSAGTPGTLNVNNLTLGPGALVLDLSNVAADSVNVLSAVDITGATLSLNVGTITPGESFTILTVPGASGGLTGTFVGLDGTPGHNSITAGGTVFTISYTGGDGNDVTLTATGTASASIVSTVLNGNVGFVLGNPVPGYVDSTLAQHQHSMVENVVYSFSSSVTLSAANFTLTGINGTTTAPNVIVSGSGALWTVTFAGAGVNTATHSIGDGEYRLALSGVPGLANSTYDFFRLMGDMDGNGTVNSADLLTLIGTFLRATSDPAYLGADDLDGDGTIGSSDLLNFTANFLRSVPAPLPN